MFKLLLIPPGACLSDSYHASLREELQNVSKNHSFYRTGHHRSSRWW